jgi:hypothetical protein
MLDLLPSESVAYEPTFTVAARLVALIEEIAALRTRVLADAKYGFVEADQRSFAMALAAARLSTTSGPDALDLEIEAAAEVVRQRASGTKV